MKAIKKISKLSPVEKLSINDEFVIIDKSVVSGEDAASSGKTSKTALWQIKNALGAEKRDKRVNLVLWVI